MLTEHGFRAIIKFVLIIFLANLLAVVTNHFFGWDEGEVEKFVYGAFLLTYITNYERVMLQRKNLDDRIRGL